MFSRGEGNVQDLSPDYLLGDELVLFIVRFGLRLTASRWGMSERTLRRIFHALGTSPRELIHGVRRREAERLLATDQPLPDVARHLGFSTEKTFSRWVHEEFGSPPTAVRRAFRRPA
jgi:AraC-like DNA-binding protein